MQQTGKSPEAIADFIIDLYRQYGNEDYIGEPVSQVEETIASLVQNHVQAKRYLTYHFPSYYEQLSEASKKTLSFQGGIMTLEEAMRFESDPLFDLHIKLRRWDEKAKQENKPLPSLQKYYDMAVRHLLGQHVTKN